MRGGSRKGAGRKQGYAAKSAEEARRIFAEMLSKEITPIAFALIRKAKNGDIKAAQLLFDRAWGKGISVGDFPSDDFKITAIHYLSPVK